MAKFIVIEGTDGCGKQTQSAMLTERLRQQGKNVIVQSFPNYESLSSGPVKLYLGGHLCEKATDFDAYEASALFMVDRLCTIRQLEKTLKEDDVVVFDRYVESNFIHNASKIDDEEKRQEFIDWEIQTEYGLLKLPKPNIVFFLNMPFEISIELAHGRSELKVGEKQDIHEKDEEYLKHCSEVGMQIAKQYGWEIVDCAKDGKPKSIQDISDDIFSRVQDRLHLFEDNCSLEG
ncbi:MAG: deoxynucleoside kinase [Clostridia bacterium]|nr:deoxynucleoside kinase [Clostridia bacterium]